MTVPGRGADPVLVIDGDCGFCRRSADALQRWLPSGWTVRESQQVDPGPLGLTAADLARSAWWVESTAEGTRSYGGARAVGAVLLRARRPWSTALGMAAFVPPTSWVAAAAYRAVARYRGRLPGATPACRTDG
ncbi:MAG: DCC1-like thiol-disulfide oxidoreductase family protein [Candidatus Nanopelagicales bacterium]